MKNPDERSVYAHFFLCGGSTRLTINNLRNFARYYFRYIM